MTHYRPFLSDLRRLKLFSSIKGQIFVVFAATFLSVFALTMLNFWSLATVKGRLQLGDRYYDLLNNILEVRRFEKNYLFTNDMESLREATDYLKRIDTLVSELSEDITMVAGRGAYDRLKETLAAYGRETRDYGIGESPPENREAIRQHGKTLVDLADRLLRIKQERIHKAIAWTSTLPFAFLGIFILLILLVIRLVSEGLLRPLTSLQATIQRVAHGDYTPTAYEGLHTDEMYGVINAFNRMARELETNQEHLLQARKIAALGTFTAGIAHELNNPINNIHLTAETYLDEYAETMDPDARELMDDIMVQSERAADIVKNLLDFSRTERPAFSSLAAEQIVSSTVALMKNQILAAGIRLDLQVEEGLPSVHGNLRNLQQVFMNLLLNASQATPAGGVITFAASAASPGFVRFDVRDTGSGITPEVRQQIFEPFFTTKSVGRGTGLGLSVTYSIVKRHGGRIEVDSEAGQWTLFSVFLPVARAEGSAPGQAAAGGNAK